MLSVWRGCPMCVGRWCRTVCCFALVMAHCLVSEAPLGSLTLMVRIRACGGKFSGTGQVNCPVCPFSKAPGKFRSEVRPVGKDRGALWGSIYVAIWDEEFAGWLYMGK